jgi:DNA-binding IscR family transcriptional regulator
MLAKNPSGIIMKEIFEILEGDFNFTECVKNSAACSKSTICTTRKLWSMLNEKLSNTLAEITLSGLMKMHEEQKKTIMYNI